LRRHGAPLTAGGSAGNIGPVVSGRAAAGLGPASWGAEIEASGAGRARGRSPLIIRAGGLSDKRGAAAARRGEA